MKRGSGWCSVQILDSWLRDLPQQFLGKRNIEVLVKAFARQMQEILQVFDDLDTKLDINGAAGQNLDHVGTIVSLSRKEAGLLAGIGVKEPVISDERYRQFLKYKVLRNTNSCTYDDIMQSIEILWRTDNIQYIEDPERPATILIRLPTMNVDSEVDPLLGKVTAIKPAGVALVYTVNYVVVFDLHYLEEFRLSNMHLHNAIPFWHMRCFDGSELMDGTQRMDARRNYDLRLGVKYGLGTFAAKERFALAGMVVQSEATLKEDVYMGTQAVAVAVRNPTHKTTCAAVVKASVPLSETFGGAAVRVTKHVAYFDGTLLMDGSRLMDAIDEKEDI